MNRRSWIAVAGLVVASALSLESVCQAEAWKFGLISDTQWTVADDGKNPNTCAAGIIKQVNQQLIRAGVKVVISVGDTIDVNSKKNIDTRALYSQDLYNAGIGFYPLRGNHEAAEDPAYLLSGLELPYAFPQIGTGVNNVPRADISNALIPSQDLAANPPATRTGVAFKVGHNFSSPVMVNATNNSISYSFDYEDARFVLLDQFDINGNYYNSTVPAQEPWLTGQLCDAGRPAHAFVFSHKNLLGGNHKDSLFGGPVNANDPGDGFGIDPATLSAADVASLASKKQGLDDFLSVLASNDVRLAISGHDHHHKLSVVKAPNTPGMAVRQLILQSDSSKFYTPTLPVSGNDSAVQEDLYRIGYYVVTVDGPVVTVDYFGSDATFPSAFKTTPDLTFSKLSTFSYSLNGRDFVIPQGGTYAQVHDRFQGTTAKILAGTNAGTATDKVGRKLNALVTTGWSVPEPQAARPHEQIVSAILDLGGLSLLPGGQTDTFVLSLSYDAERLGDSGPTDLMLATPDGLGAWVPAVQANASGIARVVTGPWTPDMPLGTMGVDPDSHTAWAVVNHGGRFAVVYNR